MIRRRAKPNRRWDEDNRSPGSRKRLLRILALVIVLVSGCTGYWYGRQAAVPDVTRVIVWVDQFFPIKSIEVSESRKVPRDEVMALLNLDHRTGLVSTDPAKLKKAVEAHPWIQSAEVRRVFPDTLVVELKEREPAAVLRAGGRELLLGEDATVITEASLGSFQGFPVLTGVEYAAAMSKSGDTTERLLAGIALANLLSEAGANEMEVDVRTPSDMVAYYEGLRIRFGDGAFEDKVERYRRLAERGLSRFGPSDDRGNPEAGEEGACAFDCNPPVAQPRRPAQAAGKDSEVEVDLRFQDRIIVRDKGGKRVWGEKTKS